MLAMTSVNVIAVRTKDGQRVNFIQAFVMQLLPNVVAVTLTVLTRPNY